MKSIKNTLFANPLKNFGGGILASYLIKINILAPNIRRLYSRRRFRFSNTLLQNRQFLHYSQSETKN